MAATSRPKDDDLLRETPSNSAMLELNDAPQGKSGGVTDAALETVGMRKGKPPSTPP
jgi:hypothetical protein